MMRSSMTPPASFNMQEYSAFPEVVSLATSLATSLERNSRTRGPRASITHMCDTSNTPASRRTAWCSSICEP